MISAIILAKNEERNIEKCLAGLKWCNEIIVIDDDSTDLTPDLAKKSGAQVISRKLINFSEQRNYGLTLVKNDWVLFIDADEIVSEALSQEILNAIADRNVNGFSLKREDVLWGKKIKFGDGRKLKAIRLGKKNKGKWVGDVHEVWKITQPTRELRTKLIHYPHQSISEFLTEINNYSTLRAHELAREGKKSSALSIIFYTKGKFIDNYLLKLGFLDGVPGLIRALMMSYYSFLVRAKLWIIKADKK